MVGVRRDNAEADVNQPYATAPFQATSATSKAAALKVEADGKRRTKIEQIVEWVRLCGSEGATRDEISRALSMPIQTVCSAVAGALGDGRLRETLDERETRNHAMARVLVGVFPEKEAQLVLMPTPASRRNH